jgi:adenosylcobinamide-GDP ribazoletransferase
MTDQPPAFATSTAHEPLTLARFALAVARCVRFYSRLPVPALPGEADPHAIPDFRIEPVGLPFAALLIVLPALLVSLLCAALRLDPLLSAALAVAALVVSTGAFHEDGLCDCADGLFGGHDVERRLEIMKDSRIGTFAGCALGLSLLLRVAALAAIVRSGGLDAMMGALAIAAVVSRVEGVRVLATLPTARAYGASAAVGKPTIRTALMAGGLALMLTLVLMLACNLPFLGVLCGIVLGHLMVSVLAGLCRRLIGGQTGDVAGAAQQLAEIGIYVGLAAGFAQ